ncbi:MAG: maleylpyruvate isomerase N-terminal domain-containing protein [Actinobacteria bacterium]|nr:maleylpyruvate isomerase N-terminal domain-containing protein [Actinomycetota bacterium]
MESSDINPTDPELITIWQQALEDVDAVCATLDDEHWDAPTPCPGWTVADVVAHNIAIEQVLSGAPGNDHEPNWDLLPHVTSDFGRFTEVGVDARRGRSRDEVLAELRETIAIRRTQLDALPAGEAVIGPLGNPTTLERMLRIRIFDTWMHEQDIRTAIGFDGSWDSAPAVIAFQQMTRSLPVIWSKGSQAPTGTTVRVTVAGPGLEADKYVVVDDEGRGQACAPVLNPTVSLAVSWPDYMLLTGGRIDVDEPGLRGRIQLTGDPVLAAALLAALSITP